jgi:tRNA G18 (ribose-2'-O)-methylase SpoU
LRQLRQQGYFLIGAETTKESMPLDQVDPLSVNRAQPRAFLFGNEKSGLLAETLQYVDLITHIPMLGTKESLNIGQAAAIYMWAWRR